MVIEHLVPHRLVQLGRPYGGCRMLLRSLINPRTFNERVQREKIFNRDPRLPLREDKIVVKDFVRQRLGGDWLTPTLWHGEYLPPLEQRNWPLPFVLKANNGCGWNVFARQRLDLDWPQIESIVANWRRAPFGVDMGEWLYGKIKPALLVEPFIGERSELPIDYKLWVFGGRVEFIQVITDREYEHKATMFDTAWKRLPFTHGFPVDPRSIEKPVSLNRMINAATILAEDFPFVRVDFYEIADQPKFGEMTFYPGSGIDRFDPPKWDAEAGKLWRQATRPSYAYDSAQLSLRRSRRSPEQKSHRQAEP
jgi:TupA-like ATPgrasp